MVKPQLIVRRRSAADTRGTVQFGPLAWPCALGRSGIKALKREGDGATPRGTYRLLYGYYRADRVRRPASSLPFEAITASDGWCDDVANRNYNRPVAHPYPASAERLWRDDGLYDFILVLDYNLHPRVRGLGSAIFMHVARDGFTPTEGCVGLRRADLQSLIARVKTGTRVHIE